MPMVHPLGQSPSQSCMSTHLVCSKYVHTHTYLVLFLFLTQFTKFSFTFSALLRSNGQVQMQYVESMQCEDLACVYVVEGSHCPL